MPHSASRSATMQILLSGLISGLAIALLAMAFQAVYLPTRIFFMALAGIYSLAPYVVFACRAVGAPWGLALATVRFDGGGGFRPLRVVE
jgi:branched-subunit amino acid ABC-type transport system permease component